MNYVVIDLSKAYGFIPHNVVDDTLRRYNVPQKVMDIIKSYYSQLYFRFSYGLGLKNGSNWRKTS